MKNSTAKRSLLSVALMLVACVSAYAKALIPFGVLEQKPYSAQFYYATNASGDNPGEDWMTENFNDADWGTVELPIVNGTLSYSNTTWSIENTTYWVRYHFTPTADDLTKFMYLYFAFDNVGEAYINGVLVYSNTAAQNYVIKALSDEAKAALKVGEDNVLAVKVRDNGGTRYMDFGLYASDFQDAVVRSDVPVQFENDAENPWTVEGYNIIRRDNGKSNFDSWLTMNFTSAYKTELSFDWHYDYQAAGQLYIDGVLAETCGTGHTYYNWGSRHFYIEPGEHTIAFRDTVAGRDTRKYFEIRNLRLKEITQIGESNAISANSQPLTFTNNSATPWTIEDGYIECRSWNESPNKAGITTTFTLSETSKFAFDYMINPDWYISSSQGNGSNYHRLRVYVNGLMLNDYGVSDTYTTYNMTLEPGEYTVELRDTVWRSANYYVRIKNIELSNNWISVDLATPGTLGYEALSIPGFNVLNDVEFLKVKGKMNDADWADIKNMQNLKAIDLSEAITGAVPDYAFDGMKVLGSVILPETATSIGEYAFRNTTIRRINIPAAVTEIKQYAFQSTPIMYVTFAEGSQLKAIRRYAFSSCTLLQKIDMPGQLEIIEWAAFEGCSQMKSVTMGDAVTTIEYYAFKNNTSLETIRFSDNIEEIMPQICCYDRALKQVHLPANLKRLDYEAFYETSSLKEIEFPDNLVQIEYSAFNYGALEEVKLPINLQILGEDAFSNNSSLKKIELPSFLSSDGYTSHRDYYSSASREYYSRASGYRNNFRSCPNIETIVMRSATPPTVIADPFASSRDKTVVTLVVPSFAVVNYKLDTYWKQFGNIIEGDDVDYWKITSPLMLTNNRRMQGKPDVDLYFNGQLTVGGAAPMTMGQFNMYFNDDTPGRLLNTCETMTADAVNTKYSVLANRWYFITPIHDVNLADLTVSNDASYVFRYYDAGNRATNGTTGNNSWKNVDTGKLNAGQGYIFHCNRDCEITFPADAEGQKQLFSTKDVTRNLTTNESEITANRSWNYVGNPYPCYYDIYYMDFTAPITVWTGSTYKAYSIADDDFVLRPMQSFFVQKPDAVDKIVFNKEGRQLISTVSSHVAGAKAVGMQANSSAQTRQVFDVQIKNENENADETRIVLNDNANMGYEMECDASKFMSFNADVPQIFSVDADGNSYAINERPKQDGTVVLAYYAGEEGEYTISLTRGSGKVQLTDAVENKTVDLSEGAYTFRSNATDGADATRFTLKFGNEATAIQNAEITVQDDAETYDLQGRRVTAVKQGVYVRDGRKYSAK